MNLSPDLEELVGDKITKSLHSRHVVLDKMLFSRPLDRSSDAEIHTATYTDTDIKVTVNVKNAGSASKPGYNQPGVIYFFDTPLDVLLFRDHRRVSYGEG